MPKIIVEDHTIEAEEKTEKKREGEEIEEEYVNNYIDGVFAVMTVDVAKFGLTPKETILSMYMLAETFRSLYAELGTHSKEETEDLCGMAKELNEKRFKKLQEAGIIDKMKEIHAELKNKETTKEDDVVEEVYKVADKKNGGMKN